MIDSKSEYDGRQPAPFTIEPPVILLGEDDDTFRALVAGMLRADGYVVKEASDGSQLQRLVRRLLRSDDGSRPELIITDICLPGVTGLTILQTAHDLDQCIPLIAMTGFGSPETLHLAKALGALEVFSKPFDLDDLRRRVHAVVPMLWR